MVEATPPTTEGELRTIKIKQLSGQDINLQVNKDVSKDHSIILSHCL